ncbi:MATE family efflux transporter [Methylotenera sp.]|uniref:lipopolysaccharide biosynthesis protein n=1 Tax=Methylotenera sp. TaxID=2051956 RepID=UPI002487686E|nr:MATE family efflux transporter [Methylotenera sp.]MDI1299022.1 MATE family efflux transporter [Methylotenera sp.]
MKRRIIAGMGANSFGLAITIVIQLVSLPLFLHYWNTSTYGVWLMLSAIPAYLSMADIGMVAAAGNQMTMSMGDGDVLEANRTFQSAQLFMMIVCCSLALLVIPLVLFAPFPGLNTMDRRVALLALSAGVLLSLFSGLIETLYRSTGRYAIGAMFGNLVRLGEWLGSILGLMFIGSFAAIALFSLVARLIGTIFFILYAVRGNHGIKLGISLAEKSKVISLVKPAISFMTFPLANALSFQGITLLVGTLFGSSLVAIFNTYRTIARISVQVTAMFSFAVWPEFSRLFGQGGMEAVEWLFKRSSLFGVFQAIGLSVLVFFISPWILDFWTHGRIKFTPDLMLLMLIYAAICGVWHVPRGLLMAINQPMKIAQWSLVVGVLVIVLAWWFGQYWMLNGVAIAMIVSELLIAIVATKLAYAAMAYQPQKSVTA